MQMYSEADVDTACLEGKRIAILGYGSQGRAHALNLKDSGFDVVVGLRRGGPSWSKAEADGLQVTEPKDAVKGAAIVAFLTPDLWAPCNCWFAATEPAPCATTLEKLRVAFIKSKSTRKPRIPTG